MKPEWRRFAPLGLYLALLATLVSIGLYIVYRQFNLALQISLGVIVLGLALFALLDPDRVRLILTGRQARYGSNALVLSLAFIGIVVVVNYLIYNHSKSWDLTENKQFTLAPETLDTLSKLNEPVKALAFFTKQSNSDQARTLLEQYKSNSNGKFDYQFIDPDANPAAAQQAKITRDGTIVLEMGGHQEPVTIVSEEELTGGLVRLLNPEKRAVYFLTGHGERSPDDSGQDSLSLLKRTLESKNYTVQTLNLLAENKIPDDAKVVVIAGPRKPISQAETDLLKAYTEKGGALVVMEDPTPVTDFGDAPDPLADYLVKDWNISLGNNIVVDLTSQQPFAPYAASYGSSPITEKLSNTTSQFPTVRSTTVLTNTLTGVSPVELVFTAQQSWAETNLTNLSEGSSQIGFDQATDIPGPVSLAASAENFQNKSRVVVIGDSDFALDVNFVYYANGDFIVNSIDWAAGQENLINLTPKDNTQRMLLPPQSAMMNLILLGTVIIVPGLALVGGIWVFIQRRRRM
jgi:gliding motility-associatede transport system auxiliary component